MKKWRVEEWNNETGTWDEVGLDMCSPHRHCGCRDEGKGDICDEFWYDTEDKQVALDKIAQKEMLGFEARLIEFEEET